MFPRSKVNLLYRLLCLLAFLLVIIFISDYITLLILTIAFYVLTFLERDIRIIFLQIITIILFIFCLSMNSYLLLQIILIINYIYYFLGVNYGCISDEIIERNQRYIRFENNNKRKEDNNMLCTIFVTVHIMILLLSIMVG